MSGQPRFQGRFIGWAGLAILATYALFVGGAWAPTYSAFFRAITLALTVGGLATWIVVAIRDPFWRPRTRLWPAISAVLVVMVLSALASSHPRLGFEYVAWSALLAALYLLLQRIMSSDFFRARMLGFATLAALVVGGWYLIAVVSHWVDWWGIVGRLTTPPLRPGFESLVFGNPSAVLTASCLLATTALTFLWGGSRSRAALALAIVLLSGFTVLVSGSRAGWLAIALTFAVIAGVVATTPAGRRTLQSAARSRRVVVAGGAAIGVIAALAVVIAPAALARAAAGGEALRGTFYQVSLRMFESSPLVGTGPGTWAPLRATFTMAGETDYYIPHAHSLYFQTLAEFGLLGVVAGVVVALTLGRLLLEGIRSSHPATRRIGWAALVATVYFAAHQLLDFYQNAPAILFAFAIPIAWLDAAVTSDGTGNGVTSAAPRVDRIRAPGLTLGAIALLSASGFLAWSEAGASAMNDGTILMNDRAFPAGQESLEQAVRLDAGMPPYRLALGLARANNDDLSGAEQEFLAAAMVDDLPIAWLNLAAVRTELGDTAGAREALDRALRLGRQQAAVVLAGGYIAERLGDRDLAIDSYSVAIRMLPSLAADPWGTAEPTRAELWTVASERAAAEADPTVRFELALVLGDSGAARAAARQVDEATRATLELVVSAWDGDRGALSMLEQRLQDRPLDYALANWCARLLRRLGDPMAAARYERWADEVAVLSSAGGFEVRVADPGPGDRIAGISSAFYGHYTYRRPTPWNPFVKTLPTPVYR